MRDYPAGPDDPLVPVFSTIIAPADLEGSSEPGLRYASSLAREQGARLIAVNVLTSRDIDVAEVPHEPKPLRQVAEERSRELLEQKLVELAGDLDTQIVIRFGDPAREILQAAAEAGADGIVITVKNRSRVGKMLMGSHAQEIILASPVPVICVPRS